MVQLKDLTFGYHGQPRLFDQLNLRLDVGHIYGLLGKNGAGKTTLLKNIVGLALPKSGFAKVNGWDATKRQPDFLRQLYFLPEEPYIPDCTGKLFVRTLHAFFPYFEFGTFERYLDAFEVPLNRVLTKLSFGQQKKFAIAFALACNTPLLIMDEPTNGLDIPSKAQFRKVMASAFGENRCVVLSTHQVRDLDNLIDTVLVLHERQIKLHIQLDDLVSKVRFATIPPSLSDQALYFEETFGGLHAIIENPDESPSQPNLELLFNAVMHRSSLITDHLTGRN